MKAMRKAPIEVIKEIAKRVKTQIVVNFYWHDSYKLVTQIILVNYSLVSIDIRQHSKSLEKVHFRY
jgi:phosphoenolpyruvate carboxylase